MLKIFYINQETKGFFNGRRRILTYKYDPRNEIIKLFLFTIDPYIGIQMKQEELTKTLMMVSN